MRVAGEYQNLWTGVLVITGSRVITKRWLMGAHASGKFRLLAVVAATVGSLAAGPVGLAQNNTNQNKQQTVTIPDPTPWPPDAHRVLGDPQVPDVASEKTNPEKDEQRRVLIAWGAGELVKLSQELREQLADPNAAPKSGSVAPREKAEKIETLARNLRLAVEAH